MPKWDKDYNNIRYENRGPFGVKMFNKKTNLDITDEVNAEVDKQQKAARDNKPFQSILDKKLFNNWGADKVKTVKKKIMDLPFAPSRVKANQMLSAKFDSETGRFYNENGDVFKTAKEAIKHNEEIDKAFGKQDQVPKQMNDIDRIYSVSTPAEKAQMRREFKGRYNFNRRKFIDADEKPKVEPVKLNYQNIELPTKTPAPVPAAPVPQEDLRDTITRLANERAEREKRKFIENNGSEGLAAAFLSRGGLIDD